MARALRDRRTWWRAMIGAVVLIAAVLLPATPASATASGDYNAIGVRIRTCPTTSCTILGLGYPGQHVTVTCYKTGTFVNGDPYWLYHRNNTTGVTGYSADYYITLGSGVVPRC